MSTMTEVDLLCFFLLHLGIKEKKKRKGNEETFCIIQEHVN